MKPAPAVAPLNPAPKVRYDLLLLLLVGMIFYIPNQDNIKVEFTIKGLNIINLMFIFTLAILSMRGIHSPTPAPLKKPFFFLFFMLAIACLIGVASDASEWVNDVTQLKNIIFFMLLYFLYYRAVQDIATLRFLFVCIMVVTFLASLHGVRQALDYGIATYNDTRRVSAPFGWSAGNANRAAAYFVIFMPLFLSVALFARIHWWKRLLALVATGVTIFVVFFTYSRQAYFILAVLIFALTLKRNWLIAILIGVALMGFESWAPETVVSRIQSTEREEPTSSQPQKEGEGEGKYDQSTESRLVIWAGAGQLITERPWGIGLNHFQREIGAYAPIYKNMDAHNVYVLFTTEAGVIGVSALVILLLNLLALGWRAHQAAASFEAKIFGTAYAMSALAVILSNIYGSRFFEGEVMGNFWILTALMARYISLQKMPQSALPSLDVQPKPRSIYA
jgi:O-antigen ligase